MLKEGIVSDFVIKVKDVEEKRTILETVFPIWDVHIRRVSEIQDYLSIKIIKDTIFESICNGGNNFIN